MHLKSLCSGNEGLKAWVQHQLLRLFCVLASTLAASATELIPPVGTWHLNADGERLTLLLQSTPNQPLSGTARDPGNHEAPLTDIRWSPQSHSLEFRHSRDGTTLHFHGQETNGILTGRFAKGATLPAFPATNYSHHFTGWHQETFDRELTPRVFELLVNTNFRARLRLDRSGTNGFIGRMKIYSSISAGAAAEELEADLTVTQWDGKSLKFTRPLTKGFQQFEGRVEGRLISGKFTQNANPKTYPWSGTRAEMLTYGLQTKLNVDRVSWETRTRAQLTQLIMAGNPAPLTAKVTILQNNLPPLRSTKPLPDRDDDPVHHPANYRLTELQFDFTLPNPYGPAPVSRTVHAWLARPTDGRPNSPAVVSVNGHSGSAWKMMHPDDPYFWHGDAFARRGYVVMAVDISHRPFADRGGLYRGYEHGDDPDHGCAAHPSIHPAGFDSDWEEDGERSWDAIQALNHLLTLPEVDPHRIAVTGISMGGEVTTYLGALEPRLAACLPAGYSPDPGVMIYNGNHLCWQWRHADLREFLDVSDFHALTAPRLLVVQTGKQDFIFSRRRPPFSSDRQQLRRSLAAYGIESNHLLHYLHYDQHHYHIGDLNPQKEMPRGLQLPGDLPLGPTTFHEWQADDTTHSSSQTLFELLDDYWKQPQRF